MQIWAYCQIVLFFTWERAEHRLTLRGLKCKKVKLPHWRGTKDFFQKKDERKKHNLADNILFFLIV
jgi:hypothetical protein